MCLCVESDDECASVESDGECASVGRVMVSVPLCGE